MYLLTFDQGGLGHSQVKPTSCLTNLPMLNQIQGLTCSRSHGEPLKENLGERCEQTSSWSSWAPGLKQLVRLSLLSLLKDHGIDDGSWCSLRKVLNREQWFRHFQQGHRPFRRDCRTCLLDMGAGKPHRRRDSGGSSSWSMGVDVVQFPKTVDEVTGERVAYAMVATLLVPVFDECKETEEGNADEPPKLQGEGCFWGEGHDWGEGLDEEELALGPPEAEYATESEDCEGETDDPNAPKMDPSKCRKSGQKASVSRDFLGSDGKPPENSVGDHDEPPKIGERVDSDPRVVEAALGEEELEMCSKPVKVKHVTVSVPMSSRAAGEVLHALNFVTTQFKSMGLYVDRLHSDKARELIAKPFQRWAAARRIVQTTTGGDDPAAAGHVESEVNQLKRRMRFYLRKAALSHEAWPLALRYAVEERRRFQLNSLGTPTLPMVPFYSPVVVKRKRWHNPGNLAPPFVSGTLISPSPLMHHGWAVRTSEGLVVHVREAVVPSPLGEAVALEFQEILDKEKPPEMVEVPKVVFPESPNPATVAGGEKGSSSDEKIAVFDVKTTGDTARVDPQIGVGVGDGEFLDWAVDSERLVGKQWVEEIWVGEHGRISRALEEAMNHVPVGVEEGSTSGEEIGWLIRTRSELEGLLNDLQRVHRSEGLKIQAVSAGDQGSGEDEVLQTTVVSLDEVRKNVEVWKSAMMNEYRSLTEETHAIEPIDEKDLDDQQVELVPGKLVCTLKAGPNGGKRKCRAVICGNLLDDEKDPCPNSYASGAGGLLIRATVKHGVEQGWGITTTDVKTAFLLAPRPRVEGTREVIIIPPKILMQAGVCKPSERWRVHRALYGFPSSPARWSLHRDSVFQTFRWNWDGAEFVLKKTPEGNLWKIMEICPPGLKEVENGRGSEKCVGHVLVYVDDVMVLAPKTVREGFMDRLRREWTVSEPETVSENGWVRFCGLEFRWENSSQLHVAQPSYTRDLLDRHDVKESRGSPMPKLEIPVEPEENLVVEEIRKAQGVTGELLWLAVRSRPDIAFAVSLMGRHLSKNPRWVVKVGRCVLEYLSGTPNRGLVYEPCKGDRGPNGTLPIVRHGELIEAYADISFAPQGGRSCQGIVVFMLVRLSNGKPPVNLSVPYLRRNPNC